MVILKAILLCIYYFESIDRFYLELIFSSFGKDHHPRRNFLLTEMTSAFQDIGKSAGLHKAKIKGSSPNFAPNINASRPIPEEEKKITEIFVFTLLCRASKGFMKA